MELLRLFCVLWVCLSNRYLLHSNATRAQWVTPSENVRQVTRSTNMVTISTKEYQCLVSLQPGSQDEEKNWLWY